MSAPVPDETNAGGLAQRPATSTSTPPAAIPARGSTAGSIATLASPSAPQRETRASAREENPPSSVPMRQRCRAMAGRLAPVVRGMRPPEVWETGRPSLRQVWHYAAYGQWTGQDTVGRILGITYAVLITLPALTAGYYLLWVLERPARLAAALALTVLCVLTPPGAFAAHLAMDAARALLT
ncbi:hypothetical protein [Actinopolymorpha rutila]|uniref:Uncharacterized protein n=1 Tax=Actinopolymorpha rutila TaxID=446787 RepID=A0A852ZW74_9ACTN|nr:hypothetical protein [Actinopolymorpha rutila]NYH92956.1 hypothetical protein [Actinopolymorpha rutila]